MIPSKASRSTGALVRTSSCIAALVALVAAAHAEQVIFTEIHYNPPTGKPEFIEIYNNTATPFDTGKWYFSDGIDYTFPDFNPGDTAAHILKPFERILVSEVDAATLRANYSIPPETRIFGPYTGALDNGGETLALSDKNGVLMTEISYDDGGKWPAAPDGTGHTLTRMNNNLTNGGWRNWMSSAAPGGTPGRGSVSENDLPTTTTQVATIDSVWKYDQNEANNDLGTAWREPGFDDSAWPEGPGLFGVNSLDPFATPWSVRDRVTYYLRKEFQFDDPFSSAVVDIDAHLDDGIVVYLNGQEIARFNMPGGEILFDTQASSGREWNELAEIASDAEIGSALQQGTNVLAIEIHNEASGSSDIAFGANISITSTEPPAGALPDLVISEIHFGNDGRADWIELHTPGQAAIDVDGLSVASLNDLSNAIALTGSVPAGGYASFDVDFPVATNGNINLYLARGKTVIDAQKLDRDLAEESFQSVPAGAEFYGGPGHTRNAANNPPLRHTDIVINEIMYDPPSDQTSGEFIELYNRGAAAVDLSNWSFTEGVNFDFPPGTSIPAGGYLVIAADAACLTSAYGAIPVIGDWGGTLRDGGELIRLEDSSGNLADEVDYKPAGDWPELADGDGSSMELRHPDMDNNISTAWADSDESSSTTMQNFTYTADFERASWMPVSSGQELHAHLVGDAHIIIENVSIKLNNTGPNLIMNPTVMSPDNLSSKGWVCQGTHWASFMDAGRLHLISDGHGDNKANRAEVDMGALTVGNSYTLSFDARWVNGKPRVIFQTLDHAFGTSFILPIPTDLGTPGAVNSVRLGSPAPTVTGVVHSPAVPAPTTPVKVSAHVASAGALSSVELVHRLDNNTGSTPWLRTPMSNEGGGLYSVTLSQYNTQGNIVQFYVEAKSGGQSTFQPKLGAARPAMWIVDSRPMPDILLRERFIISEYDRAALTTGTGHSPAFGYNFPRMSNHFFNCTFIANESEIFYNAEIRKSGSPFTRSDNANIDHGKWKLPGDRLFRNRRRSVIDASGTSEGSGTPRFYDDRIARYFLYQLGHPINEMEFVHSVVNTLPFKLRENHEPIANDFLDRNFPGGADGTLLRIDDEWRFTNDDGNTRSSRNADWSYKDSENPIRYHSEWIMRSREADYDYSNFVEWVRTLDENSFDEPTINRLADADLLCINAAVRGYDADWDTLTVDRGKNAYFFRPKDGKGWMLVHWDGDRVFENIDQAIIGGRTGVRTYFDKPYIKRRLNYYLTKLLDEHTRDSARTAAWMQAEADAVAGTGITMTASHYTNWFNNRESRARNFVTAAVNNTQFAISTSNAPTQGDTIDLSGTAPPDIFAIRIAGQIAPTFQWQGTTTWTLTGIQLQAGANALAVEAVDHDGKLVDQLTFNITKTTNASPVVLIDTTPNSRNVGLSETLALDAGGSYDPEGDALGFSWSVDPSSGVNLVAGGATAMATFSQPGLYTFTATATDSQAKLGARSIDVAVYGPEGFSTFGKDSLEVFWGYSNVDKHGNSPDSPYFSLQDNEGRLTINIPLGVRPLGLPQPELPAPMRYVDFGDIWRYDDSNIDRIGENFAHPDYDDSSWASGPGFFGFNQPGVPAPGLQTDTLRRDSAANLSTYYFRKEFEFSDDPIGAQLSFDQLVDDGVRYYLNGQELGRVRLPDGQITHNTVATTNLPVENVIEDDVLVLDGSSSLVIGTNVLAADVHNVSPGSSDLVFGTRLEIAAHPVGNGEIDLDDVLHPWIHRPLPPSVDWSLQTEIRLEKAQFGEFFAGLLAESDENGNAFRYGIGFKDGNSVAALRVNPSGTSETLASVPLVATNLIGVRLQRAGDQLIFSWDTGDSFTILHQLTLPAGLGSTFSRGGVFASTETEQSLEVSFDYAMLVDSTPASGLPLIVSEIMYHPATNPALEFIELYNPGPAALDLGDFKLVDGEPVAAFTFPAYSLEPGGYALLVADLASFSAAYPGVPAGRIIGQWPSGNLGNSGDTITLTDAGGALVTSFTYDDMAPWPTTPDGQGPSLVIASVGSGLDPNLGNNWRASAASGGSPGSAEPSGPNFDDWMTANGFDDPNAEYAGSGLSNLLAYSLGRDLATDVEPIIGDAGGFVTFSHRQRIGDSSLVYSIEISTDLAAWLPAGDLTQSGAPIPNGDGTQTVKLLSDIPTSGRVDTYYRLRVTAP